ncbi:MAG: hypothetical protein AB1468_03820, partial [Candidatus Micrarchaeota archaeon]
MDEEKNILVPAIVVLLVLVVGVAFIFSGLKPTQQPQPPSQPGGTVTPPTPPPTTEPPKTLSFPELFKFSQRL